MLDEIDKIPPSSAAAGCLYALLERHIAKRFCDEALRLPVDASYVRLLPALPLPRGK